MALILPPSGPPFFQQSRISGRGVALGLHVVIEGIETENVLDEVTALGCDSGQGYHLAGPAPPADFRRRLPTATAP